MKATEIRRMATDTSEMARLPNEVDPKIHESCFRSFHIVEKVKELLNKDTPSEVLLEFIEIMESNSTIVSLGEIQND